MVLMCVWQRSHLKRETSCAGDLSALRSINTKGTVVCFSCVTVRNGDRVINVECSKQVVIALSAIQSESYSLTTGELGRVPSEDNETDLGTIYLEWDRIESCMMKMEMMIVGGLGWKTVACGF